MSQHSPPGPPEGERIAHVQLDIEASFKPQRVVDCILQILL
jgi:hypothetical protein